jgi:hypothetical protein
LDEVESVEVLQSALDEMRHFLVLYRGDRRQRPQLDEKLSKAVRHSPSADKPQANESLVLQRINSVADLATPKPN